MSVLSLADSTTLLLGGKPGGLSSSLQVSVAAPPGSSDRLFVHPMDLSEPTSDILGFTQVCSLKLDDLDELKRTRLNRGGVVCRSPNSSLGSLVNGSVTGSTSSSERLVPAFIVRLWSRASGRYLCVLPTGASVYARGVFGPMGHFLMLVVAEDVVQFRSTFHPEHHLAVRGSTVSTIVGDGAGGDDCDFIIQQDEDGYCTLEAEAHPGMYLGVRDNGNIMPPGAVTPTSHSAHFIIQKEAMDVL